MQHDYYGSMVDTVLECRDVELMMLGVRGYVDKCRGTAIEYVWRAPRKHGNLCGEIEDYKKAIAHLTFAVEALENEAASHAS